MGSGNILRDSSLWRFYRKTLFLENGITPQTMRQQISRDAASNNRQHTITARPDPCGSYENPVQWEMVAADVTACGAEQYDERMRQWAASILNTLRESGNFDQDESL